MAETKRTGGGHGRNHGYQRPKDMKGTFKKLMGYVGKYKESLVLVAICLLISSAASVATSYLLKPLLNYYIIPGDFPGLFKIRHAVAAGFQQFFKLPALIFRQIRRFQLFLISFHCFLILKIIFGRRAGFVINF